MVFMQVSAVVRVPAQIAARPLSANPQQPRDVDKAVQPVNVEPVIVELSPRGYGRSKNCLPNSAGAARRGRGTSLQRPKPAYGS